MARAAVDGIGVDESAGPTASPPDSPGRLAAAALALATVDPGQAIVASTLALTSAEQAHDWRAASVARRARGVAEVQLRRLDDAVGDLRAAGVAARRADDPELAGEASMSLGPALMLRGQPTQGLAAVSRAIADLHGLQAARARVQRSAMLQVLGHYDRAIADVRLALPVLRRAEDAEWEVRALTNRGNVYAARRQLGLAQADLVRTQELCDAYDLPVSGAYAEQNLGCLHAARGDVPAALECFADAAKRYASMGMEVGSLLVDRATVLLSVRLLEEAREAVERAIEIFEAQHRAVEVPDALLILSTTAVLQGDADAARSAATAAVAQYRHLRRVERLPLARYASLQAQLASPQGMDEGPLIEGPPAVPSGRVRAIADQLEDAGWIVQALEARVLAARTALLEGRRRAARRDLMRAAQARRSGPADARVRAWVAEALLREAEGSRGSAKRALRAGLRVLDDYRLSLGASELRAHVSAYREAPARIGLRLALEDHDAAAVHLWSERRRASADLPRPALPPTDPELARLVEELRATMTEIADARGDGRPTHALVGRQVHLEGAIRDFARRHPASVAQTVQPPHLKDLTDVLGSTALVEYIDDGANLVALTMVDGRARLHELGPSAEIRHALHHVPFALRRMVRAYGPGGPDTAVAVIEHARDLFDQRLVMPILPAAGDRSLLVVPTGWLQGLPWSLLPSCRGRPVTVAPSATLWRTARDRPRHDNGSVVAIAGPRLQGALVEARLVAGLYPGATLLVGSDAVSALVGEVIGDAATCHIAAHGTVRSDNPLFSSLLLDDGPFTVFDLEQLGATPRHVVLAACESGLSKVTSGQEILGLTATLLSRQTATVVAPIVSIDDAHTATLMVAYHRGLRAGRDSASALAEAQLGHSCGDSRSVATAAAFICLGVGDQRQDPLPNVRT